jgi:predicted naringenin-chalcone synthase
MSLITKISTVVPQYKLKQTDLAHFTADLFEYTPLERRKIVLMYAKSGIESRYSVMPDYYLPTEERTFYPKTQDLEPFPNIEKRMEYFDNTAAQLCIEAIENCLENTVRKNQITHLITVSCTGLSAPGLDIDIVQQLELNENINRTSVNFMGCYAALHALKQADYICRSDTDAVVMVVCVELCTLHFQKINDEDNVTANLLFADGCAAALIVGDNFAPKNNFHGFGKKNFHSQLALNGKKDMAWRVSSTGFLMTLSSYIPSLIERGIKDLFDNAIKPLNLGWSDIAHWAIHPGGKRILEVIHKELNLKPDALESSYKILKSYGNMSSPTILFVLKDILDNKVSLSEKEYTFAAAFGPGLTLETAIFENR